MNILPYSFCRDDAEKKVLRHGFLLGVMATAALTAPIVLLGGAVLWSMASSQIPPAPTPVSVEDATLPAPALPQDVGADGTAKEQQVVQAVPIGQVPRAAAQAPAAARIPLPAVPAALADAAARGSGRGRAPRLSWETRLFLLPSKQRKTP